MFLDFLQIKIILMLPTVRGLTLGTAVIHW